MGKTLVLVDGSSLAFRSFYALFASALRTKSGVPTWAILGFFNSLFEIIEKYTPEMLAVCFDMAAPTFRHTEFEDYKAHRAEMPDDLASQWPLIKEGVRALSLPVYELEGYEADDVIGSLARLAESRQINVLILTGDQDAFQLVDADEQHIKVLMPGKGGLQIYGRGQVYEKLGVWPEQVIDYKALCGDTSDNIPGIKGIGPKTAVQLLSEFTTMDGIYEHLDAIKSKSLKQKLIEGETSGKASKRLATIRLDVPIEFDFDHCLLTTPSLPKAQAFFAALDFKTMITRLPKVFSHFSQTAPANYPTKLSVDKAPPVVSEADNSSKEVQLTLDLSRAATAVIDGASGGHRAAVSDFDWQVIDTAQDLDALIERLSRRSIIAVNVQACGDSWMDCEVYGYALSWCDDLVMTADNKVDLSKKKGLTGSIHAAYLPLKDMDGGKATQLTSDQINRAMKPLLSDRSIGKVVHNGKKISNILSTCGMAIGPIVFDTMLVSYIVSQDSKHTLKDQAERLLNYSPVRLTDPSGNSRKQTSVDQIPHLNIAEYAADDARLTLELAKYYSSILDAHQQFLLAEMEVPLSMVLAKMEQIGIALDLPYLAKFSKELDTDILRLESEIYKQAKRPFNINSTQQLGKILFEELGLPTKTKTKTGYSTDASVLEALADEHAIIAHLLEYRQLTKLRSTYVDALPKLVWQKDHRLHGEFNQTGTSTGRLSSSNPNLQNIPIRTELGQRMRRAIVPGRPDAVLMSADYSQIELRVLAHMSCDETLIDAFTKNQDIHARTAGEIFDTPIEQVTTEMRRIGKTLNFALIYQQGPYATAQQLGISTKEASAFIEKYFARYSKVRKYFDKAIEAAKSMGYVETLWHRRRYFRYLNDRNDALRKAEERAACNAPLQGSAADLMKLAMIKLDQQLKERALNAWLILQVHDELVLEVPNSEIDDTRQVVIDSMLLGQPLKVPLVVDVGIGPNWMDIL